MSLGARRRPSDERASRVPSPSVGEALEPERDERPGLREQHGVLHPATERRPRIARGAQADLGREAAEVAARAGLLEEQHVGGQLAHHGHDPSEAVAEPTDVVRHHPHGVSPR